MVIGRVGAVTVTYNSANFLEEFVACCRAQSKVKCNVYVIDNASQDNSSALVSALAGDSFKVTLNARNLGVAAGNNQGIQQALHDGCEWILLINNDTAFEPTLIADLLEAGEKNKWRVVVPKILYDEPSGHIWYAGGSFTTLRGPTGYHIGMGEKDIGQFDEPIIVDYSPTCCMLIHRSVFDEVGLMDETYFVYFDDTDFCWRLKRQGIRVGYWPRSQLVHKVGGSTGGLMSPFTAEITARNRLYFAKKHFGALCPLLWLPVFLAFYVVRYLVRSWNPKCFAASVRGTRSYFRLRPSVPPIQVPRRDDSVS
jgi:GT2 family glycosyltransferase